MSSSCRVIGAPLLALLVGAAAAGGALAAQVGAPTGEVVDRSELRVCADPNNLPFSNDRGEGYENKIAELLADRLGVPVSYTFYPQSMGFVRNTLRERLCDLIIGVVAADELVQNTNPYYRSTYVIARRAADSPELEDLAGERIKSARIGVVAGTPPADLLARRGLLGRIKSYQLTVDTRFSHPAQQMMEELARGEIDVALAWGPIAGYFAKQQSVPITLAPLASDRRAGLIFDYRISMGVRHNEPEWKAQLNELLRELKPEIDRILIEYGVPLLDNRGELIRAEADPDAGQNLATLVPEPEDYRTAEYRAPVPKTLAGATVVDTAALRRLIAAERPVLVDVLPLQRKPPGRDPKALWIEPARDGIPGTVWLPNAGYGELTPEFAAWFASHLERLTGGDRDRPLVFYCDADCWMSWNAARRAARELGYRRVHWYPEGVDGWRAAGLALVREAPEPQPDFVGQ
ncbi:MAG TPA: quinoprotein dehydrogenase-associated putative ABC transporter substrate-binding protein [Geminicoccaceae bacterium]|nr:quinoprotein dehydrogenase-associated putative ABC transporter substrate-binding protein [Geminicoccaceae bacterium]